MVFKHNRGVEAEPADKMNSSFPHLFSFAFRFFDDIFTRSQKNADNNRTRRNESNTSQNRTLSKEDFSQRKMTFVFKCLRNEIFHCGKCKYVFL